MFYSSFNSNAEVYDLHLSGKTYRCSKDLKTPIETANFQLQGGKIAQAVAASPEIAPLINSIIAISSPMDVPVLSLDHYFNYFYNSVNTQWKLNRTVCTSSYKTSRLKVEDDYCLPKVKGFRPLDHILLVTIGGGIRDTMVHDSLTNSIFSDVHSMVSLMYEKVYSRNFKHQWLLFYLV